VAHDFGGDQRVETYVSYLRKSWSARPALIHTIRLVGYTLRLRNRTPRCRCGPDCCRQWEWCRWWPSSSRGHHVYVTDSFLNNRVDQTLQITNAAFSGNVTPHPVGSAAGAPSRLGGRGQPPTGSTAPVSRPDCSSSGSPPTMSPPSPGGQRARGHQYTRRFPPTSSRRSPPGRRGPPSS